MNKVPFTNDKDHPVYSPDGKLVQPGETRMIDAPPEDAPAATPEPDPLVGLLDNSIAEIVPHLAALDGPALDRLLQAERDGKTRKTLIEAIELRIMEVEDAPKLDGAATTDDEGQETAGNGA